MAGHPETSEFAKSLLGFEDLFLTGFFSSIGLGEATVLVAGMGRVGAGAYRFTRERGGETVVGLDRDTVREHTQAGNDVLLGDVTDSDLWERVRPGRTRLVLLAMVSHEANLLAVKRLRGPATAQFGDELEELRAAGADFAEHV